MQMETVHSSETFLPICQTIWHRNPEDVDFPCLDTAVDMFFSSNGIEGTIVSYDLKRTLCALCICIYTAMDSAVMGWGISGCSYESCISIVLVGKEQRNSFHPLAMLTF
jgi:hypothetical protein